MVALVAYCHDVIGVAGVQISLFGRHSLIGIELDGMSVPYFDVGAG